MTTENPNPIRRSRWILAIWLAIGFVVYALSAGPAIWLSGQFPYMSEDYQHQLEDIVQRAEIIELIYSPADWMLNRPPIDAIWERYLLWWVGPLP